MQSTVLRGRYKITKLLGRGGFGETFLAEDGDRPGKPICVVKQLRPNTNSQTVLRAAQRLFNNEAEILYKLGNNDQIPQLLAHFEEDNQFFLVQEFIEGHDLSQEIAVGRRWREEQVISFLEDVLTTLKFVHEQNVIHRDIKPSNLIRRRRDGKIVLIDFGVVKEIQNLPANKQTNSYPTIAVGTPGYVPNEQLGGKPRFSSDIYALGITAIQALTQLSPAQLVEDSQSGEIVWQHQAQVSDRLATILNKMVRSHFRDRYQFVDEVLNDLKSLHNSGAATTVLNITKKQATTSSFRIAVPPQQPVIQTIRTEVQRRQPLNILLLLLLIPATVGATLYMSGQIKPPQAERTTATPTTPATIPQPGGSQTPERMFAPSPSPTTTLASPTISSSPSPTTSTARPVPSPQASIPNSDLPQSITSPSPIPPSSGTTTRVYTAPKPVDSPKKVASAPNPQIQAVPLTEVQCSTTSAAGNSQSFVESLRRLTIGKRSVTAIAELGSQNSNNSATNQITTDTPAGVACQLNSPEAPQFSSLNLAFGINDKNQYITKARKSPQVRLTIYLDRQNIGSVNVAKGQIKSWGINVASAQDITLQAECLGGGSTPNVCPALVFTQVDLK